MYMAVKKSRSTSQESPGQLAFIRIYRGTKTSCSVSQAHLDNAHIDCSASNRPAVVFRIAAKNELGYGPATQIRWVQGSSFFSTRIFLSLCFYKPSTSCCSWKNPTNCVDLLPKPTPVPRPTWMLLTGNLDICWLKWTTRYICEIMSSHFLAAPVEKELLKDNAPTQEDGLVCHSRCYEWCYEYSLNIF